MCGVISVWGCTFSGRQKNHGLNLHSLFLIATHWHWMTENWRNYFFVLFWKHISLKHDWIFALWMSRQPVHASMYMWYIYLLPGHFVWLQFMRCCYLVIVVWTLRVTPLYEMLLFIDCTTFPGWKLAILAVSLTFRCFVMKEEDIFLHSGHVNISSQSFCHFVN